MRNIKGGPDAALELAARGLVDPVFRIDEELQAVRKLMLRYDDVPMSLADGCLVRLSEIDRDARVLTLDRNFRIYRRHRHQVIPLIIPESVARS
jgi:predicted nucleic acid-binding protein